MDPGADGMRGTGCMVSATYGVNVKGVDRMKCVDEKSDRHK